MSDELVTIATYRFAPKAEMARALLEEAGIMAYAENAEVASTIWFLGGASGMVKLRVPADQVDVANALLHEHAESLDERHPEPLPDGGDSETTRCLACGAAMSEEDEKCSACGWSYETAGENEAE